MRVAIAGATGETGASIVNGLLSSSQTTFEITALVRPSSVNKPEVLALQSRGVRIALFDTKASEEELAAPLKGIDVAIGAFRDPLDLTDEKKFASAAKAAGVKRFVPCFFATTTPRGILSLRDEKEEVLDHILRLFLPYTVIDVGWWYQLSMPRLPSGRLDRNALRLNTQIFGDGNVPCARTDLRDIGKYVAHIIADQRTLNQKILAYSDLRTHNELYDLVEKLSEEHLEREYISTESLEANMEALRNDTSKSEMAKGYGLVMMQYQKSWDLRGDNTPEYAKYLGYQIATDLYPGVVGRSFEDYCKEVLEFGLQPLYSRLQTAGVDA